MTSNPARDGVSILHDDGGVLVVSKPAGLLCVPSPGAEGRTLLDVMRSRGIEVLPVHRLDRDVSGVVVLARTEPVRARLELVFRAREVRKLYWALVRGRLRPAAGRFTFPIRDDGAFASITPRGKPAVTVFRTLRNFATTTEVEIDLQTGRYNQIRLHFAHAGHPLVGERKYARGKDDVLRFRRVALHAQSIAFAHPETGAALEVTAPLPEDLAELLVRAATP